MSIDHTAERAEIAATTEHTYGCWEQYAEIRIEDGTAETGAYDEMIGARELISLFHQDMVEQPELCGCHVNGKVDEA